VTGIRVVRGDPTPEQVAALTAVLLAAFRDRAERPTAATAAPWPRGHVPGWTSRPLPGWRA
jgi:hypothetical protein